MSYFFPRGKGPLVSFLFATRKRVEMLKVALESIFEMAKNPDQIEIIFKIDSDDHESLDYFYSQVKNGSQHKVIITPRGLGYKQMHVWVNQMAHVASGDWQLIMNDDMRFTKKYWDDALLNMEIHSNFWHGCREVCGVLCHTEGRPEATEFQFVRRKVIEVIGHWSLNVHSDNWMSSMLSFMGCMFSSPITVAHLSNSFEDDVRRSALAAYPTCGRDLNSPAQLHAKCDDVTRLLAYIQDYHRSRKVA